MVRIFRAVFSLKSFISVLFIYCAHYYNVNDLYWYCENCFCKNVLVDEDVRTVPYFVFNLLGVQLIIGVTNNLLILLFSSRKLSFSKFRLLNR